MAEDIPFGSFAPSSPQQAVDAVTALRKMHPDWARQIARYMAPGLYDYATEPEPSYDSRLRALGGSIGQQGQLVPNVTGKVPGTDDPRTGPALADMFNLATMAMPTGAGSKAALIAAPMAGKLTRAAAGIETAAPKGIRAYHGSPHDFERFDLSKIGTGEGAQSYGHGLYFAENEGVARSYRDALSHRNLTDPNSVAEMALKGAMGDRGEAINSLRNRIPISDPQHPQTIASIEALRLLERGDNPVAKSKMYEVNINARPEQFLDWDKPISSQAQPVQNAWDKLSGVVQDFVSPGSEFYRTVGMGADNPALGAAYMPQHASQKLREAGIPGIKYLDQGSRFDPAALRSRVDELRNVVREHEKGIARGHEVEARQAQLPQWRDDLARAEAELRQGQTSNYVLFSDDIIKILRKYAIPGMLAPPAVAAATQTPFGSFAPQ